MKPQSGASSKVWTLLYKSPFHPSWTSRLGQVKAHRIIGNNIRHINHDPWVDGIEIIDLRVTNLNRFVWYCHALIFLVQWNLSGQAFSQSSNIVCPIIMALSTFTDAGASFLLTILTMLPSGCPSGSIGSMHESSFWWRPTRSLASACMPCPTPSCNKCGDSMPRSSNL